MRAIFRCLFTTLLFTLNAHSLMAEVAMPVFAPPGEVSYTATSISISCATQGATIHYTTNGINPTESDALIQSGSAVYVGRNLVLKARAWKDGESSAVASQSYSITGQISAGDYHVLALKSDGTKVSAWGRNLEGQLATGTTSQQNVPVNAIINPSLLPISSIAAKGMHSLAITGSHNVISWGRNLSGELGNGTTANQALPVTVLTGTGSSATNLAGIVEVCGGVYSSYALKLSGTIGTVWAWGSNTSGKLGDGTTTTRTTAVQVKTGSNSYVTNAAALSAGYDFALALTSSNKVLVWGGNTDGELGDGGSASRYYAYEIPNFEGVVEVAAGYYHSLALKSDGSLWAWGSNTFGQLGDGTKTPQHSPVKVMVTGTQQLDGVVAISAGYIHSMALKADGTVWAWGYDSYGLLGDGPRGYGYVTCYPVQVKTGSNSFLTNVVAISAGYQFSVALTADGTIYTWGSGSYGQMGNNTVLTNSYATPSFCSKVINTPPSVSLSISAGPYMQPATLTLSAVVSDTDNDVSRVDLFENGSSLGSFTSGSNTLTLSNVLAGQYTFTAVATDITGELGTASITASVTLPPTTVGISSFDSSIAEMSGTSALVTVTRQGGTSGPLSINYSVAGSATIGSDYQPLSGTVIIPVGAASASIPITPIVDRLVEGDETVTITLNRAFGYTVDTNASAATVTIHDAPPVAKPIFATRPGYSLEARPVVVTCATEGAVIHYTINGEVPTESSTTSVISGQSIPNVPPNAIIRLTACLAGYPASDCAAAVYQFGPTIKSGAYHSLAVDPDGKLWAWGDNHAGQIGNNSYTDQSYPALISGIPKLGSVAVGDSHSLCIDLNGCVWAWGAGNNGQLGNGGVAPKLIPTKIDTFGPPPSYSRAVAVAAGYIFSVALDSNGDVWAWGHNNYGQIGDNSIQQNSPVRVAGIDHIIAIAAGYGFALALRDDGTVWGWGANGSGQLGDGTTIDRKTPVQVVGLNDVVALDAGSAQTVALKADGTVWTWGANTYGVLGTSLNNVYTPQQVQSIDPIIAVAAGLYHMIALTRDGTIYTWGCNGSGELGDGTKVSRNARTKVSNLSDIVSIDAGNYTTFAIDRWGSIWATGYSDGGVLGNDSSADVLTPARLEELVLNARAASPNISPFGGRSLGAQTITISCDTPGAVIRTSTDGAVPTESDPIVVSGSSITISAPAVVRAKAFLDGIAPSATTTASYVVGPQVAADGAAHNYALQSDGTVWAWGDNTDGGLGIGSETGAEAVPQKLAWSSTASAIASSQGGAFSGAIDTEGSVWLWGANDRGQLGTGGTDASISPVQQANLSQVVQIALGRTHSLALKQDGTVWAWGDNSVGALGTGTMSNVPQTSPVQVTATNNVVLDGVTAITSGSNFSVALKADGTVWAWGYDAKGQLGDSYRYYGKSNSSRPVRVGSEMIGGPLHNVIAIASGVDHTLALKADGTVWAWGGDVHGQLGDNRVWQNRSEPTQARNLTNVIAIYAGNAVSFAVKADGTVWAWGDNTKGQYGNGTLVESFVPIQIATLTSPSSIAIGSDHALAAGIAQGVDVFSAWGTNTGGSLGNGNSDVTAVQSQPQYAHLGTDSDGDGVPDWQEILNGTDPLDFYSGSAPVITILSGDQQNGAPNTFLARPIIVQVSGTNGNALPNAPVTLTVVQGGGCLTTDTTASTRVSIFLQTDADGQAVIYYKEGAGFGLDSQIQVVAGLSTKTITATATPLVGLWKFEEGDGITALDSSNTGNDGNLVGGVTWATGFDGRGAVSLDGSSGYIRTDPSPTLDIGGSNAFTVMAWVQVPKDLPIGDESLLYPIITMGNATSDKLSVRLKGGSRIEAVLSTGQSETVIGAGISPTALADGNWHHIGFSCDQSGSALVVWDGTAVAYQTGVQNPASAVPRLWIGHDSKGKYFTGSIDDVQFLREALSETAIRAAYNISTGDGTLPDWWKWKYLRTLNGHPNDDTDGDGKTDAEEYRDGTSPSDYFDGYIPVMVKVSGDDQNGVPNTYLAQPFVVQITKINGTPYPNAPVTFTVEQGGGIISIGTGIGMQAKMPIRTDNDGRVTVYYREGPQSGAVSKIRVEAGLSIDYLSATASPLVGLWVFNGNAYDYSNTGNSCDLHGNVRPSIGFDGKGAVLLDGTGYLATAPSPTLSLWNGFAVMAWVQVPKDFPLDDESQLYPIITMGDATSDSLSVRLKGGSRIEAVLSTGQSEKVIGAGISPTALADGNWHHIGFSCDRSGSAILVCDGTTIAYQSGVQIPAVGSPRLWIGRDIDGNYFSGSIDDVQFGREALSEAAIRSVYNICSDNGMLPDWWKWKYFHTLSVDLDADLDGDGVTNSQEYEQGTSPNDYYNGESALLTVYSGNNQTEPLDAVFPSPLKVKITSGNQQPLANAPVTFSVSSGSGTLSLLSDEAGTASQTTKTDFNGVARVYLTIPGPFSSDTVVKASLVSPVCYPSVTFIEHGAPVLPRLVGTPTANGLQLDWAYPGLNADSFTVQRSTDGITWSAIGVVTGSTNTFVDVAGSSVFYLYRIIGEYQGIPLPPCNLISDYGNYPSVDDTDGDGIPDLDEVMNGFDPLVPNGYDDHDGDGYPDVFEIRHHSDPNSPGSIPAPDFVVDVNGGGDYTDIASALDAAKGAFRIILVKPGVYKGVRNRNNVNWSNALIISASGAANTVIDAEGANGPILSGNFTLNGFELKNCCGNAVEIMDAKIVNCIFDHVTINNDGAEAVIRGWGDPVEIDSCTVTQNSVPDWAFAIQLNTGIIKNTITWANGCDDVLAYAVDYSDIGGNIYNQNWDVDPDRGTNIQSDPLFIHGVHISSTSPCRDHGDPSLGITTDMDGELRSDGGPVPDIGADEYVDKDNNGLPDWWELAAFNGIPGQAAEGDYDQDGVSNIQEYQNGTDPTDYFNGVVPAIALTGGSITRIGIAGQFLETPVSVEVVNANGDVLANAPVTFSVTQRGGGGLSLSNSTGVSSSVVTRTDGSGIALVWCLCAASEGITNTITVRSGGREGPHVVVTTISGNQAKSYSYDSVGRLRSSTPQSGTATSCSYDDNGNILVVGPSEN